jgi:aspartate kinase
MPQILSKQWLVQKYGGTSIGKLLPTVSDRIIPSYLCSHKVAVVCSARSGATKSTGTTSLLLEAIRLATIGDRHLAELNAIVEQIKNEHLIAAKQAINEEAVEMLQTVKIEIKKDCEKLHSLLKATVMLAEISDRTSDRVLAIGETLSCRIVAASLKSKVRLFYIPTTGIS